jgi:Protein of unknown function (DUF3570)
LKNKVHENIRGALAFATCGLLAPGTSQAVSESDPWDIESAILFYSEKDRVDVVEPAFNAKTEIGDDEYITIRGVLDSMTGASPNGATITDQPQTFTGASGQNTYTVDANAFPLVSFSDTRVALGLDWDRPTSRTTRQILTATGSVESDYFSGGASLTQLWDSEDRLTTWTAGIGGSLDIVSPTGGAPTALQRLSTVSTSPGGSGEDDGEGEHEGGGEGLSGETKFVLDLVFGVTRVLSPRSLLQFNYSYGYRNGYLNDPYKLVSMIDTTGSTVDYIYEGRPDTRNANIFFLKWVYHFPEDVLRISQRYFTDDWGVNSNTTDLTYRFEVGRGFFIEPYGRYYTQTAADFYRYSLPNAQPIPANVSADYRLAEMTSTTSGLRLGMAHDEDSEWSVRVEYMKQTGNSHPADAIGKQKNFDLYPGLEAYMVELYYFAIF